MTEGYSFEQLRSGLIKAAVKRALADPNFDYNDFKIDKEIRHAIWNARHPDRKIGTSKKRTKGRDRHAYVINNLDYGND